MYLNMTLAHFCTVSLDATTPPSYCTCAPSELGRVDGFDQDEAEGERDEGTVIARSLLATKGDALEALEFADG
ncbi:MAG: hypothetical protein WBW73_27220, partial [Rhodoplanes sp.]